MNGMNFFMVLKLEINPQASKQKKRRPRWLKRYTVLGFERIVLVKIAIIFVHVSWKWLFSHHPRVWGGGGFKGQALRKQ